MKTQGWVNKNTALESPFIAHPVTPPRIHPRIDSKHWAVAVEERVSIKKIILFPLFYKFK